MTVTRQRYRTGLTRNDDRPARGRSGQPGHVGGITGQDSVSRSGQQDDGRVDGIARIRRTHEHPSRTADLRIYSANIDSAKQSCQLYLPPVRVAPSLGHHHGVATQFHPVLLGRLEAGDHCAIVTVDRH
jgi:hypothetical protein